MSEASPFYNNAIFFIEIDKVKPNPFQPRRDFDQVKLQELAESIRMYGILQPLVVTRKEVIKPDGGLTTEYELIAGERRLRASKLVGLREVPAIIRAKEDDDRVKLELAIIENLQREDISPVDKARAFKQLADKFSLKHGEIAKKVGKSREYVSNCIRILMLPEEMLVAISEGKITEGHARPLLMLVDRPQEQEVLFRDIMLRKLTVRDAERISRKIAVDRVRKPELLPDPELMEIEHEIGTLLGTRVNIDKKEDGGRIQIDFFNTEDLKNIVSVLLKREQASAEAEAGAGVSVNTSVNAGAGADTNTQIVENGSSVPSMESAPLEGRPLGSVEDSKQSESTEDKFVDQQVTEDTQEEDEEIYSVRGFSL